MIWVAIILVVGGVALANWKRIESFVVARSVYSDHASRVMNPLPMGAEFGMWRWTGKEACPRCGYTLFWDGPHGGSAANVKCAGCGVCWWYGPPFPPRQIDEVKGVYNQTLGPYRLEDIL